MTQGSVNWGGIGANADAVSAAPFLVHIDSAAADGTLITLKLHVTAAPGDPLDQDIILRVENGSEFQFEMPVAMDGRCNPATWTANNLYIIKASPTTNSFTIRCALTIEPGTRVRIDPGVWIDVQNGGSINANGTPSNHVVFFSDGDPWGSIRFSNAAPPTVLDSNGSLVSGSLFMLCEFRNSSGVPAFNYRTLELYRQHVGYSIFIDTVGVRTGQSTVENNLFTNAKPGSESAIFVDPLPSSVPPGFPYVRSNTVVGNLGVTKGAMTIAAAPTRPIQGFRNDFVIRWNNVFGNSRHHYNDNRTDPTCNAAPFNWWVGGPDGVQAPLDNNYHGRELNPFDAAFSFFHCGIFDRRDNPVMGDAEIQPISTISFVQGPAFVRNITYDKSPPFGAGRLKIKITFTGAVNRNPPLPKITFGPTEPYTQRSVSLNKRWGSPTDTFCPDTNTLCAETNITEFTGDGIQTIMVSDGIADWGFPLPHHDDRFRFEIRTAGTATTSGLMASGGPGRIDLSWLPAYIDTLAGYNLYRSSIAGGPYERVNAALISEARYSDFAARQGVPQFYIYRLVNTDLEEGPNSNEVTAVAADNVAPVITHTPRTSAPPGLPITISADITDNAATPAATLRHRGRNSGAAYTAVAMTSSIESQFTANISASAAVAPGLEYYIEATDGPNTTQHGSATAPHIIVIAAKGDINGDGSLGVPDIIYLLNYLFAAGPAPIGSADLNASGSVSVGDLFYLVNHLFAGGPGPA